MKRSKRTIYICIILVFVVYLVGMTLTMTAYQQGLPTLISPNMFSEFPFVPISILLYCIVLIIAFSIMLTAISKEKKLIRGIIIYIIVCAALATIATIGLWIYGANTLS